ncbi:unnamed protein product [Caretta caretta]
MSPQRHSPDQDQSEIPPSILVHLTALPGCRLWLTQRCWGRWVGLSCQHSLPLSCSEGAGPACWGPQGRGLDIGWHWNRGAQKAIPPLFTGHMGERRRGGVKRRRASWGQGVGGKRQHGGRASGEEETRGWGFRKKGQCKAGASGRRGSVRAGEKGQCRRAGLWFGHWWPPFLGGFCHSWMVLFSWDQMQLAAMELLLPINKTIIARSRSHTHGLTGSPFPPQISMATWDPSLRQQAAPPET